MKIYKESLKKALYSLERDGIVSNIMITENSIQASYHIDLPQFVVNDIESTEDVVFDCSPEFIIPLPYFRRENFPNVIHLLRNTGNFKYPCLFQAEFSQIALNWDANSYVYRLYEWLYLTARGELHNDGQPLENIFLYKKHELIIPLDFNFDKFKNGCILESCKTENIFKLLGAKSSNEANCLLQKYDFGSIAHSGIINPPCNFDELYSLFDDDNKKELKNNLKLLSVNHHNYEKKLIIIIEANIKDANLNVTQKQEYVFLVDYEIKTIGLQIGIIGEHEGNYSQIISPSANIENFKNITITPFAWYKHFDQLQGRIANGCRLIDITGFPAITQIGIGAIGGQIARNITQSGFPKELILIDNDLFYPHNTSRWLISSDYGNPKVKILSDQLNDIIHNTYSFPVYEKVEFGSLSDDILKAINLSEIIIDTSASITVQRTIDKYNFHHLDRITNFLSPDGKTSFLFFTPKGMQIPHTHLEISIYNFIISNQDFNNVLNSSVKGYSYSGDSCRSISYEISTNIIGIHSHWASHYIEKLYQTNEVKILLCNIDDNFQSKCFNVIPEILTEYSVQNCSQKVYIAKSLIENFEVHRTKNLPNETGGILIGAFDVINNAIYLVNCIDAPIDSDRQPTSFLRGNDGVEGKLNLISNQTHGNLKYMGEWHSHPTKATTKPSEKDNVQLDWLRKQSEEQLFPYFMLIMGDNSYDLYC
ncbi:MAG: Mov34/MPN/PAD-1 family protein [Saprospiraceae bacterium]|nr:Mov34/MPN/PAD-1 family protein [Saprospiraceae bacterium]